MIDTELI